MNTSNSAVVFQAIHDSGKEGMSFLDRALCFAALSCLVDYILSVQPLNKREWL